jgi:cystathionine gamma-lyase
MARRDHVRDATRVVRAGYPETEPGEPFLPGPVFAAPFHSRGDPADSPYVYSRYANPTWERYERALGELEDAEVVLFASGMAAVTAVLCAVLEPGESAVLPSDCYLGVRALAEQQLARRGVEVSLVPTAAMSPSSVTENTGLLWLESPSNPGLDVCDIAALAQSDNARVVAVDNTFATPLGQRPLDLGADLSVTSATKHLSGHADVMMGYVATRDPVVAQVVRDWRRTAGSIPGPFEAWLAHRSLATLELRLTRGCDNAAAIADLLAARDDVRGVRYPGLASDPAHELSIRQMSRFGTIVSFELGSRGRADAFLGAAELVTEATSFGGVHTSAERRARWGQDEVPEGFIRLSAGCEDPADLLGDIERALAVAG